MLDQHQKLSSQPKAGVLFEGEWSPLRELSIYLPKG